MFFFNYFSAESESLLFLRQPRCFILLLIEGIRPIIDLRAFSLRRIANGFSDSSTGVSGLKGRRSNFLPVLNLSNGSSRRGGRPLPLPPRLKSGRPLSKRALSPRSLEKRRFSKSPSLPPKPFLRASRRHSVSVGRRCFNGLFSSARASVADVRSDLPSRRNDL